MNPVDPFKKIFFPPRVSISFAHSSQMYLASIVLKRTWADEVRNVSILMAFGVHDDGYREILGAAEGAKEDKAGWGPFMAARKERGLGTRRYLDMSRLSGLVSYQIPDA